MVSLGNQMTNQKKRKNKAKRVNRTTPAGKSVNTKGNSHQINPQDFFSLQKIIDLLPGNIFWKDREGKMVGCNNHVAHIFGLNSPRDIYGKRMIDLMPAELAAEVDRTDQRIMASQQTVSLEENGLNDQNEPAVYLSYKIPLCNEKGDVIGLLGTSLDITEQKRLEKELILAKQKAEASDQAKSRFLAVVNHEMRTPLTGILGLVDCMKKDDLTLAEKKNLSSDLEHCTQNLLYIVNDILDFSRLEAGQSAPLNMQPIDLDALIHEVIGITNGLAKNKGLWIHSTLNENHIIMTDTHMLRQILINLLNNAVKFTQKGGITLRVKTVKQSAERIRLSISIQDTGKGIPPDKQQMIFEPFQQIDDPYTRESSRSGTGLGLAIVKRLAAILNLKLSLVSKPGKGSTFSLTGEFETLAPEKYSLSSENQTSVNQNEKILKVLLVEDDKIVRYIHEKMLLELQCNVETCDQGQLAIDTFNDHHILFVDIGLPDISGFEVIRRIRDKEKIIKTNCSIIALTGYTGDEERTACLEAGANEVMNKPINKIQLTKILKQYGWRD